MTIESIFLLIGSGFLAGIINAVAGGGTFFTFPALIFAGVPPIAANATSTIAVWPGAVASALTYRKQLSLPRRDWALMAVVSLIGGGVGALVLLSTPAPVFEALIPWLMLVATLLFAFGDKLRSKAEVPMRLTSPKALLLQGFISLYGGYFGAGIGILMLALLSVLRMDNIHAMNALKTILGSAINGVAVVVFVFSDWVDWQAAIVIVPAAIAGGYAGAAVAQKLPKIWVRRFVIGVGALMTLWFFAH